MSEAFGEVLVFLLFDESKTGPPSTYLYMLLFSNLHFETSRRRCWTMPHGVVFVQKNTTTKPISKVDDRGNQDILYQLTPFLPKRSQSYLTVEIILMFPKANPTTVGLPCPTNSDERTDPERILSSPSFPIVPIVSSVYRQIQPN
jgi:hypothetical protein